MKIIKLTEKDFDRIRDLAQSEWMRTGKPGTSNVCKSYIKAYGAYLKKRNLILKNGILYENTDSK